MNWEMRFAPQKRRHCGECQLCCKLIPIKDINKPAGERCKYQKRGVGCSIYARRPNSCAFWNCAWLVGPDTDDLKRPDRARYVIDPTPDYVTLRQEDGSAQNIGVVQIWCDPSAPDAWRDPALFRYIKRRGAEGMGAIVRFGPGKAIGVFPPNISSDGQWHFQDSIVDPERSHSVGDVIEAMQQAVEAKP